MIKILKILVLSVSLIIPRYSFAQWALQNSGTNRSFGSIYFSSKNVGYTLPFKGPILRTLNASSSWDSLSSLTLSSSLLYDNNINFVDDSFGFISTHNPSNVKLYRTKNMGYTWKDITPAGNLSGIIKFKFLNRKKGYAYANSAFDDQCWMTNDSGNTWKYIPLGFSLGSGTSSLPTMFFVNDSTGYIAGGDGSFNYKGVVKKTTNSGKTFSTVILPKNSVINSIYFPNADTGYVISRNGGIFSTTNAGTSWDSLTTLALISYESEVFFTSGMNGFVISGNRIYRTINGGKTWKSQDPGTKQNLRGIFFTDANNGYIVGDSGTILKTINSGVATQLHPVSIPPESITVYPIPASKNLLIEITSGQYAGVLHDLTIYNELGELVLNVLLEQKVQLNIDLVNGIYYYIVGCKGLVKNKGKIIIINDK